MNFYTLVVSSLILVPFRYQVTLATFIGAALLGITQWLILGQYLRKAWRWLFSNVSVALVLASITRPASLHLNAWVRNTFSSVALLPMLQLFFPGVLFVLFSSLSGIGVWFVLRNEVKRAWSIFPAMFLISIPIYFFTVIFAIFSSSLIDSREAIINEFILAGIRALPSACLGSFFIGLLLLWLLRLPIDKEIPVD